MDSMDPLDLLSLIHRAADESRFDDVRMPPVFTPGDFEMTWRRDPRACRERLDAILLSTYPGTGLELLLRSGALCAMLPELVAIKDLGDDPVAAFHKDVWDHTKKVVAGVPALLELRWGALMHDIGKARTRRVSPKGVVTFHNHDMEGARMVDGIERRLGLFKHDPILHATIRNLVLNHLRPAGYKASWTDSGIRRLVTDVGGMSGFQLLMTLSRADLTTKNPAKRNSALARGRELEERVRTVIASDNLPKLPKGTMGKLIDIAQKRPGPWTNQIRDRLEAALADGSLPKDKDPGFYAEAGLRMLNEHCQ